MTTELIIVLGILFSHWVSDFVLQSDRMARDKSKDMDALLSHVAVYYISMSVLTGSMFWYLYGADDSLWGYIALWWMVNGVLHIGVDFLTSRINSKLWAKGNMHNFFVSIGFDQFVHYACLFGTASWMLGII